MLYETIRLTELYPALPQTGTDVVLKSYARASKDGPYQGRRGAVVVLHGGGYYMKSITEYEPVALRFMAEGWQAFTLDYSLLPAQYPQQLFELAAAVGYIRRNADKYAIDPDRIVLCGFSAGAHLGSMLANKWTQAELFAPLGLTPADVRPNAAILSYPPATVELADCLEMFKSLCGSSDDEEILRDLSPVHTLNENTPPTFVWQTVSDEMVSVRHSLILAEGMQKTGIPFELHLFPEGPHAMALCDEECAFTEAHLNPHAGQWFPLALNWLEL